jgi:para-nitrobenzyl esterase
MGMLSYWAAALGAVAALIAAPAGADPAPVAHTAQGDLAGALADGVESFKGVPFAAPPVGELRWRPPGPAPTWSGVRQATAFGPACLQPTRGDLKISEDCLTINVWRPAHRPSGARLPVMVWIYGGAFIYGSGSSPFYDGTHFAQHGVVLVDFNYRLGRAGFFSHPALDRDGPGPFGNYGLMDQIAALKWVRANIAAFGGDPRNVTMFGESAGGISVNYLLTSPAARGLFDKAISESGFGRLRAPPIAGAADGRDGEHVGLRFAAAHGVTGEDAAAAASLRALPSEALNAPYGELTDPDAPSPVVDGRILTETVAEAFAKGDEAAVPYLEGGTSYEASLIPDIVKTPETTLARLGPFRDKVVALYGGGDPAKLAAAITTDIMVTEPDRFLARRMTVAGEPVFVYHFSYVPAAQRETAFGAPHGGEISYVFGTLLDAPLTIGERTFPAALPEDRKIGEAMTAYWAAFAKTGDPGSAGGPVWPRYTQAGGEVLEFGVDGVHVRPDFAKVRLDWAESVAAITSR